MAPCVSLWWFGFNISWCSWHRNTKCWINRTRAVAPWPDALRRSCCCFRICTDRKIETNGVTWSWAHQLELKDVEDWELKISKRSWKDIWSLNLKKDERHWKIMPGWMLTSLAFLCQETPMPAPTTITVLNSQTLWAGAPNGPCSLKSHHFCVINPIFRCEVRTDLQWVRSWTSLGCPAAVPLFQAEGS